MGFDPRLLSPPAGSFQFSPHGSPSQEEEGIELNPWDRRPSDTLDPPPLVYKSTDELVTHEEDRLYNLSPRSSLGISNRRADHSRWVGWQFGAALCAAVVAAGLIINLVVTIWAATSFGLSGGIGTVHVGPCSSIKRTGLWLHVGINLLSTMMLGASNYVMQALCSPARGELEEAHSQRKWLDIGIQSFRNLTKIKRSRMVIWILLAASSIPLHLMFNSAILVSLTANEYVVAAVTEDFINGASWTLPGPEDYHYLLLANLQQNLSTLERLESPECIRGYGSDYVSDRRHALVVVSGQESDSLIGILAWHYNQSQNSWVCGANIEPGKKMQPYSLIDYDCSTSIALANNTWLIGDREVGYCLSQAVEDRCRLQFAVPIMIVVICSNVLKLACMVFTIWHCKESTFVTLGDAVSGFLEKPDPYTAGMCIATKKDFQDGAWPDQEPMRWTVRRHFWYEAVGIARYVLSNTLCAIAVIALSLVLRFAIGSTTVQSDIATLWKLGFGAVSSHSLIRWKVSLFGSPGLMKNVLLANSPQVILSLIYVVYNRMFTCMSFSKEWHDFADRRRPLRVTNPQGQQRSTYFLSLPYRYLVPILSVSVATHWILSQSLFLVAIDVYDEQGNLDVTDSILTCGFSCIAMIFLIGIGWLVFIVGVSMGLRRYQGGMPLVGSCSAAIAAACHPGEDEPDVALVPVKWGVVSITNGVGHCALSGRYVSPPITWRFYMGKREGG